MGLLSSFTNPFKGGGLLSDPMTRLQMGAAMMSGNTLGEQLGGGLMAAGMAGQDRRKKQEADKTKTATLDWLRRTNPELAQAVEVGAIEPSAAFEYAWKEKNAKLKGPDYMEVGGQLFNPANNEWITPPVNPNDPAKKDPYAERRAAAEQLGLTPQDPAYQGFVLTGKMPREDQAPLTATDKQAILSADEMVAANENALQAIDQATALSDKANAGWGAGMRASIGNNLPDWMVPDAVSSPDSSLATTDMDNAIIGQALTSLKTIFGGNPTEGERKILLDLQGSSSMPAAVRKNILGRAKEMAQRRLEFNKARASELRGGTYYKPGTGLPANQPTPAGAFNGGNIPFKVLD